MQNLIGSWVVNHHQYFIGLAIGFVLSNPGTCAMLMFNAFVKIPGVGAWIGSHPDEAKAWADGFDKKIDELVDAYAKKSAPQAPAA